MTKLFVVPSSAIVPNKEVSAEGSTACEIVESLVCELKSLGFVCRAFAPFKMFDWGEEKVFGTESGWSLGKVIVQVAWITADALSSPGTPLVSTELFESMPDGAARVVLRKLLSESYRLVGDRTVDGSRELNFQRVYDAADETFVLRVRACWPA